jgi:DNA modification methylase
MIRTGNCIDLMSELPDNSIDAVVTDPPYELGFMGKSWDASGIAYNTEVWKQCLRILKPGGHLLAFGGSRTYHRLACAIEDAGFEIRDQIMWVYGSGFPKSMNIGKAIDKAAGVSRKVVGVGTSGKNRNVLNAANYPDTFGGDYEITEAATQEAKQWEGWGTALKPAHEPIVVARKAVDGTIAQNVMTWGTGAINIDECRVAFASEADKDESTTKNQHENFGTAPMTNNTTYGDYSMVKPTNYNPPGRWPANFIHDGSDEVLDLFPNSKGGAYPSKRGQAVATSFASGQETEGGFRKMGDDGSAARFFYCAKPSTAERNAGLDGLQKKKADTRSDVAAGMWKDKNAAHQNHHPTVKPITLMRYLVKMVVPPNGVVLDPFLGSGTTGVAAIQENIDWIGFEMNPEYADIARRRTEHASF